MVPVMKGVPGEVYRFRTRARIATQARFTNVWKKTPGIPHAYTTAWRMRRTPANRQLRSGVHRSATRSGSGMKTGFESDKKTPDLKNTSAARAATGPGPAPPRPRYPAETRLWRERINPLAVSAEGNKRKDAMDHFCQKCHDHGERT